MGWIILDSYGPGSPVLFYNVRSLSDSSLAVKQTQLKKGQFTDSDKFKNKRELDLHNV